MKRSKVVHWSNYTGALRIACGKRDPADGPKLNYTTVRAKVTCKTCVRIMGEKPTRHPPEPVPETTERNHDNVGVRMAYAGAIGLLCELSTQLSRNGERADNLDSIEVAVADFCKLTGWTYRRIVHRIEVFPPTT